MKVVGQLARHFWSRKALRQTEADYLVDCGFVRSDELVGYDVAKAAQAKALSKVQPLLEIERVQERFEKPSGSRKRRDSVGLTKRSIARISEAISGVVLERLTLERELERELACKGFRSNGLDVAWADFWSQIQYHPQQWLKLWKLCDRYDLDRMAASTLSLPDQRLLNQMLRHPFVPHIGLYRFIASHENFRKLLFWNSLFEELLPCISNWLRVSQLPKCRLFHDGDDWQAWSLILAYSIHRSRCGVDYGREFEIPNQCFPTGVLGERIRYNVEKLTTVCAAELCNPEGTSEVTRKFPLVCPHVWQSQKS